MGVDVTKNYTDALELLSVVVSQVVHVMGQKTVFNFIIDTDLVIFLANFCWVLKKIYCINMANFTFNQNKLFFIFY